MLSLSLNQQPLRLRPATTVALEYANPAFSDEVLPANYTYQLVLPLDANRAALGFPDLIENIADVRRTYDGATLEDDGVCLVQRGRLLIRSISESGNTITTTLLFGLGLITDKLKTRTLRSFNFGGLRVIDDARVHANATVADPATYDYVYAPLHNPYILGDPPITLRGAPNHWSDTPASGGSFDSIFYYPWPKLRYVYRQTLAELGIRIKEDFFDEELAQLVVLSNGLPTLNVEAYGDFHIRQMLPDLLLKDVLLALKKDLGVLQQILPDGQYSARLLRDVLADPEADDWSALAEPLYTSREIPDLENKILTYTVENGDDLGQSVDAAVDATELGTPAASFSDLPTGYDLDPAQPELPSAQVRLVEDEQVYYRSDPFEYFEGRNKVAYNWCVHVAPRPTMPLNATGEEEAQALTYTATQTVRAGQSLYALYPAMKVVGNNPAFGVQNDSTALRLAFFRGRQPYLKKSDYPSPNYEPTYPLVTPFAVNALGERIGNYSLQLDGPDGTYEQLLKGWLEVRRRGTPVKFNVRLSAVHLQNLDYGRKISIHGNRYLIQQIAVTAPIAKGAIVTLVPLPKG